MVIARMPADRSQTFKHLQSRMHLYVYTCRAHRITVGQPVPLGGLLASADRLSGRKDTLPSMLVSE
eukprot:16266328-Heterocapsa_arctica.AAC.1